MSFSLEPRRLFEAIAASAEAMALPLYVVGGFVRDLLLGIKTLDLDFVVEREALGLVQRLAGAHGGAYTFHPHFLTATWTLPAPEPGWPGTVDIATARTEMYPEPAALPLVTPASIERDLFRRDFTINAMALRVWPAPVALLDVAGSQQDVRDGLVRVLHPQSFIDDPTRIFRAVRFEQRLGFRLESNTLSLLSSAVPLVSRLSGERLRHEFDLILAERKPERSLLRLASLGVFTQVNTALTFDKVLARAFESWRILAGREITQRNPPLVLTSDRQVGWALLGSRVAQPEPIIERLMLPREEAKALTQGGQVARRIPDLRAAERPSQVAALLDRMSHAALVAGMALTAEGDAEGGMATHAKIAAYAREWRYVQPALNGDDLKRMGLPPGKLFGTLLRQLRLARLDGLVATAQDEQVFVRRALESRTQQNSAAQSSADQHNAAADSEPP